MIIMRITLSIVLLVILYHVAGASESPCIKEFKNAYKNFGFVPMQSKGSQKASHLEIGIEKIYRNNRPTEKDTVHYLFAANNKMKMFNKHFTYYSDGRDYIVIMPILHKIAIQKIINKDSSFANPVETIIKTADALITDENMKSCSDFVNTKKQQCKELTITIPKKENKGLVLESIRYILDVSSDKLIGSVVNYTQETNILCEKYSFITVDTNHPLTWDMTCTLEEIVFDKNKILRKEYKNFEFVDLRNQKNLLKKLKNRIR